jgi:hypothetical protein
MGEAGAEREAEVVASDDHGAIGSAAHDQQLAARRQTQVGELAVHAASAPRSDDPNPLALGGEEERESSKTSTIRVHLLQLPFCKFLRSRENHLPDRKR